MAETESTRDPDVAGPGTGPPRRESLVLPERAAPDGAGAAPGPSPATTAPGAPDAGAAPGADPVVVLRDAAPGDLAATAALQQRYLPLGLFPQLGDRFVRRWHRTFCDSPAAWAGVLVDPDGVCGYALLATDQRAYLRDVLTRDRLPLAVLGAAGLLRRPGLAVRFARTRARRYARRLLRPVRRPASTGDHAASPETVAVLHAVVVDHRARGRGLAAALLDRCAARARAAGATRIALVTDADGAEQGAVELYRHLGWTEVGRHRRDGRELVDFQLDL
ncbi:GNAT family N-acetyltransferase [Kineococcus terrestris]|uniref:GNAT family N-acetyltransferase n=1 Tax=Kineococcus terrestris TaxID=2044856 RepID=UPI0034DB7BC0